MKKVVGEHLRAVRGELSQAEMARIFGVKQQTYSAWERGEKECGYDVLAAIALRFGVSLDWLFDLPHKSGGDSVSATGSAIAAKNSTVNADLSAEVSRLLGVVESQMRVIEALSGAKGDGK